MKWKPLLDYVRNEMGLDISKDEIPIDLVEHMERQEEVISNLNKINAELKRKLKLVQDSHEESMSFVIR